MELMRDIVAEAGKKSQWGVKTYENIKKKEDDIKAGKSVTLAPRKSVREFLESHLVITGPLDGTKAIFELNVEDQCTFFSNFPGCGTLLLKSWKSIPQKTLRCISMTMGDRLRELDLSFSGADAETLGILLVHLTKIQTLKFSHCPNIDGLAMGVLTKLNGNTVRELFVDHCEQFKSEPLLALAGQIGVVGSGLRNLEVLDLGFCPVQDRGLMGIGKGCSNLRFLNLQDCREITDAGVVPVVRANPLLQLLCLSGCLQLTDKSAKAIGKSCKSLTSINLSLCAKLTNVGISAVAKGCPELQNANFSGVLKLTEGNLVELATNCPGLLMLNITGCEEVTPNGLKSLIKGLKYVEAGVSFVGFKPKDAHVEQKITDHMNFLRDQAIGIIRDGFEKHRGKKFAQMVAKAQRLENAALQIQQSFRRYKYRMFFYDIWMGKRKVILAGKIQRVWRGFRGRRRAREISIQHKAFLTNAPQAVTVQKMVRGFLTRIHNWHVAKAIVAMYNQRWQEAQMSMCVRLQAFGRRFLAHHKVRVLMELRSRRRLDETYAATLVQSATRRYLATLKVMRMRYDAFQLWRLRKRAVRTIENWYMKVMNRFHDFLEGKDILSQVRRLKRQVVLLMRVARGFLGREKAARAKIQRAVRMFAATAIQRVYRGSRVLHWRDMRMNVIAAYVLDRHNIERADRVVASRMRYHEFIVENRKDSASESDEGLQRIEADFTASFNWVKSFDFRKNKVFWTNTVDGEVVYEEPILPFTHEKSIIGMRVRIFWPVMRQWYDGVLSKFNMRRERHRVNYEDGDYEWMNLRQEADRVQIMTTDGSWVMYNMYESDEMVKVKKYAAMKQRNLEASLRAYADAEQWKLITPSGASAKVTGTGDVKRMYMYISTRTGEIRAGVHDAPDWVIQDDGRGFPRFYNEMTKEKVYDDPRFEEDEDEELEMKRKFIMEELRFAMFFCKELWESYCAAKKAVYEVMEEEQRLYEEGGATGDAPDLVPDEEEEAFLPPGAPSPAVHKKPKKKVVHKPRPGAANRVLNAVLSRLKNSPKPKQLAALVILAKGMYRQVSVVDRPISKKIAAEIEYAVFLAERLAEVQEEAFDTLMKLGEKRKALLDDLTKESGVPVYCRFCRYQTQKHLEYCATCGRKQVYFLSQAARDTASAAVNEANKRKAAMAALMSASAVADATGEKEDNEDIVNAESMAAAAAVLIESQTQSQNQSQASADANDGDDAEGKDHRHKQLAGAEGGAVDAEDPSQLAAGWEFLEEVHVHDGEGQGYNEGFANGHAEGLDG